MSDKFTHIDLFSGIGGFALAAETVWGGVYHNAFFCDCDKFCQAILRKNFGKDIIIYGDIRAVSRKRFIADSNCNGFAGRSSEVDASSSREQALDNSQASRRLACKTKKFGPSGVVANSTSERSILCKHEKQSRYEKGVSQGYRGAYEIDLLTGGFPCQPFSAAGKRRGTSDDRYLWPEMLRVIKEFKPRWIIGENVNGITNMAQQQGKSAMGSEANIDEENLDTDTSSGVLWEIIKDLEHLGYTVQPLVIPACAVNAPHRRDRIWIIAHTGHGNGQGKKVNSGIGRISGGDNRQGRQVQDTTIGTDKKNKQERRGRFCGVGEGDCTFGNSKSAGFARGVDRSGQGEHGRTGAGSFESWERPWFETATEFCGVDDGISVELDGLKFSKARHRVERLKSLGNAIVPAVAIEIMKGIKEMEEINE